MTLKINKNKLSKREVLKKAKESGNLQNFYRHNYAAYKAAKDNGWYADVKNLIGQRHSITKEECHEIALLYNRPRDWERGNARSYSYAKRLGWIPELTKHMKRIVDFTDDSCAEIALLYETRNDFAKKAPSAWNYAWRNGILDIVCAHMKPQGSKAKRIIYVFEFEDNHAYVGLTYNIDVRIEAHLTNKKSAVYRHIKETSSHYTFKTLSDWLPEEKASKLEEKTIDEYRSAGWTMLNTMHGGGLGACKQRYTKEFCAAIAKGFHYKKDFMTQCPVIYSVAHQRGWFKEISAHMEKWTKNKEKWPDEKIREVVAGCRNRHQVKLEYNSLYQYLCRNHLLDKYFGAK